MANQPEPLPLGFVERRRHPRVTQPPLGVNGRDSGALTRARFATSHLPSEQQFSAWAEHMAIMFDVSVPDAMPPEQAFPVVQTTWDLDGILLVQETSPAMSYVRSADRVRMSPIDHWCITVLRAGKSWTEVDGKVAENQPGMLDIRSLGLAFCGRKTQTDALILLLPVDLFADMGGLPSCNNAVIGGHRAELLIDHLVSLEHNLHRLSRQDLPHIRNRLRDMIFDTITPVIDRNSGDRALNVGLMTKARRFIAENLTSPDLTVESLCRELALSRTRLYELFESSGGVAHYIRRRRLQSAHERLADPSDVRKVAEIAYSLGFDSAANFSRAFTHQFGYSPNHVRIKSHDAEPSGVRAGIVDEPTFVELIRRLSV